MKNVGLLPIPMAKRKQTHSPQLQNEGLYYVFIYYWTGLPGFIDPSLAGAKCTEIDPSPKDCNQMIKQETDGWSCMGSVKNKRKLTGTVGSGLGTPAA